MNFKFDAPFEACPLCNAAEIFHFHEDYHGIKIFKCKSCESQFMNPQYSEEYLSEYYAQYTKDESEWDEALYYGHNYYLSLIEPFLAGRGKLLDVGCGKGHCLTVAKQHGWKVTGYEIDAILAQKLSAKLAVDVFHGNFPNLSWKQDEYQVVYMHHVLEHLKNPLTYLTTIHSLLQRDGIFFLALPNIRSRSSVIKFYLEKLHIRKRKVGSYYDTSHHLWYFTPVTLTSLLTRLGFTVLHMRSGHPARPNQSNIKRWWLRTVSDRILWKSTFIVIAQKNLLSSGE